MLSFPDDVMNSWTATYKWVQNQEGIAKIERKTKF